MSQQHRDGIAVRASVCRQRNRERRRRLARATASVVGRLVSRGAAALARAWAAARLDVNPMRFERLDARQMLDGDPIALNFAPVNPLGVQVYQAKANGALASATQADVYSVALHDGGKLSFAATTTTDASTRLHVVVKNEATGAALATVDAGANGAAASLQNLALAAGTYDVTVTSDSAPAGDGAYALRTTVNASIQTGTPANASTGAAASLAGSGKALANGGTQYAATGTSDAAGDASYYKLDLAAGQFVSAALSGAVVNTGVYGAAAPTSVYFNQTALATGDLDGDGLIDVVVGGQSPFGGNGGLIVVLHNNGDGTFDASRHYDADYAVTSIAIGVVHPGDLPDVYVGEADEDSLNGGGGSELFRNNGFGNFNEADASRVDGDERILGVAIADVNGDGVGDLVRAGYNYDDDGARQAYLGIGYTDGGGTGIYGGTPIERLVVGDVDGDGNNDFITARADDGGIEVDYGAGSDQGYPITGTADFANGNTFDAIAYADATGDGVKDIVGLRDDSDSSGNVDATVVQLDANGNDRGETGVYLGSGAVRPGASLAVADLNSDGRPDLVATAGPDGSIANADGSGAPYELAVAFGTGDGDGNGYVSFTNPRGYHVANASGLAVADVTGDGRADLVALSPSDPATQNNGSVDVLADTGAYAGGAGTVAVINPAGKTIASGVSGDDAASAVQGFVAPSAGTYYFRIGGSANLDYALTVTTNAAIGLLPTFFANRGEDVTGAADATGYVDRNGNGDQINYFTFGAVAGDTITLHLSYPTVPNADGSSPLAASLQFDKPDGTNVFGASSITYTVPAGGAGTYGLFVVANAGAGLYDLSISGAHGAAPAQTINGFGVSTTTPNYGFPKPLSIYVAQPIDESSVDLSKITVNGHAATSFSVENQTTLLVTFADSVNVGDGTYTASVASGAFKSLAGVAVAAGSQAFSVDTGPKVTQASIKNGDTIEPGAHAFNFAFNKSLATYYSSGNFGYLILDNSDIQLTNTTTGKSYPVDYFQLGPDNVYGTPQESTTIRLNYGNLPEGKYELRLVSGTFAFSDKAGVPLDGDNTGTLPSGDGHPYGDYVVDFNVDRAAAASLGKPAALAPHGGQAYAFAPIVGAIDPDSDTDDYTFAAQAGDQFTAAVAVTSGGLQPSAQLLAPDGSVVATAAAASGGGAALFQNVKLSATGTYTVRVASLGSSGAYRVSGYLNAGLEAANNGGAADDSIARAQPLDFGDADNGGIDRAAVVGADDGATADFYSFALAAGQRVSASIAIASTAGVGTLISRTLKPAATAPTPPPPIGGVLALVDATGHVIALGTADPTALNYVLNDVRVATAGTYYLRILTAGTYALAVARDATFEVEPNDAAAAAQDVGRTKKVAGYLDYADADGYAFNAAAGDAIVIQTTTPDDVASVGYNGLQTILRLYAPDGTLVANNQGGAIGDANDARITYAVPSIGAGTYRVVVTAANATSGTYGLSIAGATAAPTVTAPAVVASTPPAYGAVAVPPTTITFTFGEAIDPNSVGASDLSIAGGTVSAARVVDGRTVEFTVGIPDVDHTYAYSIAANAITSIQGVGNAAYASSVVVDKHGPRVVSVSPNGSTTAPFNTITFTFDEPLGALPSYYNYTDFFSKFTAPDGTNLLYQGSINKIAVSGNTFTVTFADQTQSGAYAIALAPGLTDAVGNKMDQDGDGINGEPTQDGYATTITVGSPDLIVSSVQPAGGAVYGTPTNVTWTVKNSGTATAGGAWVDRVYLSADGTYDGDDVYLGQFAAPNALAPGASYTVTKPLTFPLTDAAAAGTMYVIVLTDPTRAQLESNDDNNATAAADVVALPPIVDLAVTNVTAPANLAAGQSYVVNWTLSNLGNKDFTGSVNQNVYLSSDNAIGNDPTVGGFTFTGTIAAGTSVTQTATVTVPAGTSGAKYFVVEVNPYHYVFEHGAYANDSAISAAASNVTLSPAPDFIVANVKGPTSTAYSGGNVTVTWTDANQGTSDFNGSFNEDVYLSASADGANAQYFANVRFSGPIAVGGSVQRTATFALPADFAAGSYYPIVVVDSSNDVYENPAGETNNTTIGATPFAVAVPSLPDLTVVNVIPPSNATGGQSVPVRWTDKNLGPATIGGTWTDTVYLSSDAAGNNVVAQASITVTATLAAGGTKALTASVELPKTLTGTYYAFVRTDVGNAIFEANEQNNSAASATTFAVAAAVYPDLTVTSVQGPASGFSGQQTSVTWFVKNVGTGPTSVPQWYDNVYVSSDATLDSTDKQLGAFLNPGYLAAGQSYQNTASITLPAGIQGPYYLIVKADGYNAVDEFGPGGEDNNVGVGGTLNVSLTPPPDLRVVSVAAPTHAFSGQPATISFDVRNFGPGPTAPGETSWSDRIYLSTDATLDDADVRLAVVGHAGGLKAGQDYVGSASVVLPVGISGTYYFLVEADTYGQVAETGFESNNVTAAAAATLVALQPPPDLAVTSVSTPAAVLSGHAISATYTVANQGSSPTPNQNWTDALYLSKTTAIDSSAILIAQQGHSGALAAGASYTAGIGGQLPYDLASGTYYAIVVTDSGNVVFEVNDANNTLAATASTAVTYAPPDLIVPSVVAPTTAASGGGFLASWTVKNQGAGDTAVGQWSDYAYLSTDSVLGDGDDLFLGSYDHSGVLNAGASYASGNKSIVIPSSVAAGDYYLIIATDGNDRVFEGPYQSAAELNNASAPQKITITRNAADLQISAVGTLTNATQGSIQTVSYTVRNAGNGATNANYWYDDVYLSTSPSLSGTYYRLGRVQHSNALAAGASYTGTATIGLTSNLPVGNYYVVVATDSLNQVDEPGHEDNNVAAGAQFAVGAGAQPDLAVSGVTAPTTATSGQPLSVHYTVSNVGGLGTAENWYDSVYLSLDQNLDPRTDIPLGSILHQYGLASGGSYAGTASFSLPAGLAGQYYVFVQADSSNRITTDANLANNVAYAPTPVTVTLPAPTDIAIGTVTLPTPATGGLGTDISITYTVKNLSDQTAKGTWQDSLYLSKDATYDVNDAPLGTLTHVGDVAAGDSYTATLTAPVPGIAPGSYYVIVRTDVRNVLPETTKANNVGASLGTVSLSLPTLTAGVAASGTLTTGRGVYYKIDVPFGQTLYVTLASDNASADNELYVRYGQVPTRSAFDQAYGNALSPNQTITVPLTKAGTYYLLAYGASVPGGETYKLTASLPQFGVVDSNYGIGGTAGNLTVQVNGAKFDRTDTATLTKNGVAVATATAYYYVDQTRFYATFDLTKVAAGTYDVTIGNAAGGSAVVQGGLQVVGGGGGKVDASLDAPGAVLHFRNFSFNVDWSNSGINDAPAPLIAITGSTPIGQNPAFLNSGGYTFYGLAPGDGPAGILRPGQVGSQTFFSNIGGGTQSLTVGAYAVDPTVPFDYDALAGQLIDQGESSAAFAAAFARMKQDVGPTIGDVLKAFSANANVYNILDGGIVTEAALLTVSLDRARAELTISIRGAVVAPDVSVDVVRKTVTATNLSTGQIFSTTSLRDGSFTLSSLTPGTYSIGFQGAVVDGGGSAIVLGAGQHLTNVTLQLSHGQSVAGVVRSGSGGDQLPAANVVVTVVAADGSTYAEVTDSAGAYQIAGLPAGATTLYAQADGQARAIQTLTPGPGVNAPDLVLVPEATVAGTIALPAANPAAVLVQAQLDGVAGPAGSFAATVAGGRFGFSKLPAGTYAYTITQLGSVGKTGTFTIVAGEHADLGTIALSIGATIRGAVRSADAGVAVAGLPIELIAADGTILGLDVTGAGGAFAFGGLPAGAYVVRVLPLDTGGTAADVNVTLADAQQLSGVAPTIVAGDTLRGTATAGGAPLAGVTVVAAGANGATRTVTTDAAGRYAFAHLPPGAYAVSIPGVVVSVTLPTADASSVIADLVVAGAGTISGHLLAGGKPLAGTVLLYDGGTAIASVDVDADGAYTLYVAQPGTYDLGAETNGGASFATASISIAGAGQAVTHDFAAGTGTLSVTVTDANADVKDDSVFVSLLTPGGSEIVATLTPSGAGIASVANLAPGTYLVVAASGAGQRRVAARTVTIAAGGTASLTLAPAPAGEIDGTVTDAANGNKPLAAATVAVYDESGNTPVLYDGTAADGTFSIGGLPSGVYDVVITAAGRQTIVIGGVSVANGAAASVSRAMAAATTHLTGRLVDTAGRPIVGGSVYVTDGSGRDVGVATSGADGTFSVDGAAGSSLTLTARAGGYRVRTIASGIAASAALGNVAMIFVAYFGGPPVVATPASPMASASPTAAAKTAAAANAANASDGDVTPFVSDITLGNVYEAQQAYKDYYAEFYGDYAQDGNTVTLAQILAIGLDKCGHARDAYNAAIRAVRIQDAAYDAAKSTRETIPEYINIARLGFLADGITDIGAIVTLVTTVDAIATLVAGALVAGEAVAAADVATLTAGSFGLGGQAAGLVAIKAGAIGLVTAVSTLVGNLISLVLDPPPDKAAASTASTNQVFALHSIYNQFINALFNFQFTNSNAGGGSFLGGAARRSNVAGIIGNIYSLAKGAGDLIDSFTFQRVVAAQKQLDAQVELFRKSDSNYHQTVATAYQAFRTFVRAVATAKDDCDGNGNTDNTTHHTQLIAAPYGADPNDIVGPAGFGPASYTSTAKPLSYQIEFENEADATAPAQVVSITQKLDADLDARTFRLGTIVLAGHVITPPADAAFYQSRVDLTADLGVYVDVFAGIDVATGTAFWTFTAIDPATGAQPINPLLGLLPPDVTSPEGEGFVTYSVSPLAAATTGTEIAARATIVFDVNAPIDTPTIVSTLDVAGPTSKVNALPPNSAAGGFALSWTGVDDDKGSGISGYTVYVSIDGRAYATFLADTTATSAVYNGAAGHAYAFYTVATDNAGNVEAAPATPDATTSVAGAHATLAGLSGSVGVTYGAGTTAFGGTVTGSPAAGETVAVTLNGKTVNATIDASGHFAATFDTGALGASTTPYAVTYSYAGNDNLGGATDVATTTLAVAKKTLTVSVGNATKTFGTADPTFAVAYDGFVNGQAASNLNGTLAINTTEPAAGYAPAGTYAVTAAGLSGDNYDVVYVPGTLTVTRAALVITAASEFTPYGQPVPVPIATYAGFADGESAANLTSAPTLSTNATSTSAPGTYAISIGNAADANYDVAYVAGTVVVTRATPSVSLTTPPSTLTYDGTTGVDAWAIATLAKPDGTVTGALAPTGDVTLQYYRGATPSGTPLAEVPVNAGTYTLVAYYAGDGNYSAAASAPVTFTISKATPTLTLPTPPANLVADGTTGVDAWAKPTLTGVAGAPAPTGAPTLSYFAGSTATGPALAGPPTVPGTFTVVANYAGNSNYSAVTSAPQTFAIQAPSQALSTTFKVNDGAAQRSMVKSLTVTFSAGVTLGSGAVTLVDANGNAVAFTLSTTDNATYVLTFPAGTGASLVNGRYTLVVHADKVGGGTLPGDQAYAVFRLFGDGDGNGTVNNVDATAFKKANNSAIGSAKYVDSFDFNGDGKIDGADSAAFAADQGVTI